MPDLKLRRRGGFGPTKPSAVKFVSVPISDELIDRDPWGCFLIFDRAARLKHLTSDRLTLADVRVMPGGGRHLFVFEVDAR